ncbi:MAG: DUF2860 family protein [Halieaceae bacterium]
MKTILGPYTMLLLAGLILPVAASNAAVQIPEESGFSGFINLGLGGVSVKSNLMAETGLGFVDLGDDTIDGLNDSPDRESSLLPVFNFEASYTFAESRTQIYVGNLLEDFVRFEMNAAIGVRHEIGDAGILGANLLASSIPTEVWKDPFLVGEKRKETERESAGYRVQWSNIYDSGLEFRYTARDVEIDDERSGQSLDLTEAERELLVRDGDHDRIDLRYEYTSSDKRHVFTPGLAYIDHDRDGDANSMEGFGLDLNYIYVYQPRLRFVVNAGYARLDADEANPIYGVKDDSTRLGLSLAAFYGNPFGLQGWVLNVSGAAFKDDHEIRFYDSTVRMLTVGMLRRF